MSWMSSLPVESLEKVYETSHNPWKFDPDASWWTVPPQSPVIAKERQQPQQQQQGDSGKLWFERVKAELLDLICGQSKKYDKLRNNLNKSTNKSEVAVVSAIAVEVSRHVGMDAAFLVPICALGLQAIVIVGRNAFCKNIAPGIGDRPSAGTQAQSKAAPDRNSRRSGRRPKRSS